MKTSIMILCFCMMSVWLMGINQIDQTTCNRYSKAMLSPDGDYLNSTQRGASNLPIQQLNRDRSWHLQEILHRIDHDQNGEYEITGQDVMYYNSINPAQLDSLVYSSYDLTALTYLPVETKKYYYTPNGEDIIRVDLHYSSDPASNFAKSIFEYDNQHRLIRQYKYTWDNINNVHKLANAFYWTIVNNEIADRSIVYYDEEEHANYFTRVIFNRDLQGRNIGYVMTSSMDSLTWTNAMDCVTNYHSGDTSTGIDQIHYFSHDYVLDLYNKTGYFYFFSMIADYTTRTWTNNNWVNSMRTEYGYNNYYQLTTTTQYFYSEGWNEENMYTCSYDADSNFSQYALQTWNEENSNWNGYQEIHNLTWGEYVGTDDETAPVSTLGLNAYPNPFKDEITINLNRVDKSAFEAGICNLKGQLVRSFTNQKGKSLVWDGRDNANNAVAAGLYFVRLNQNGKIVVQKVVRVK